MATILLDDLRHLVTSALDRYGYTRDETEVMADVILYSQLRGGNQGIAKLLPPGMPRPRTERDITVRNTGAATAVLDAAQNPAMVALMRAAEVAADLCRRSGVGIVGVNSTSTSSGSIGYYARRLAQQGQLGIVLASSPATVAPHGTTQAVFGTNPVAIAVPAPDHPIVLDMTTAAMAYYGVVQAAAMGQMLPEGVAFDAQGEPVTNAQQALGGALRPFDRAHRGSGLAFMVQLLAGPLVGASGPGLDDSGTNWGHLVIAIDPDRLGGRDGVATGVTELARAVHAARPAAAGEPARVPGERGDAAMAKANAAGSIDLDPALLAGLRVAAGA